MKKGVIFGVFDLLHIGHARVLTEAKRHCDHLTVCVINDKITQSYKRKPIIEEDQRLELVQALKSVDLAYIIDFRSAIDMQEMEIYFVSERLRGKKLYYVPDHRLKDVVYLPYSEKNDTSTVIKKCRDL